MRIAGITAEYNPFHNGHLYHADRTRELSGADCVITVMSGDFTQRGEPAVCDKWERAAAAVKAGGADLVLELPFAFACSKAEEFAAGAVDMLAALGADVISFGCEAEDPECLRELAAALVSEAETIEKSRIAHMREGISSAKAYELAARQAAGDEAAALLLDPNNILAIAYMKRILWWRQRGYILEDLPVRRYGSGYRDASHAVSFAGAGALREMILGGEDISRYVPAVPELSDMEVVTDRFMQLLKGIVLRSTPGELGRVYGVGEGMENSIIRETRKAESLEDLIFSLTSRRYTAATVRRALTHILMGTKWEDIDTLTGGRLQAGKLLAAGKEGRKYLRNFSGDAFRIITNINKEDDGLKPFDREHLKLDEKAADLYNHLCGRDIYASSDRVKTPYIMK